MKMQNLPEGLVEIAYQKTLNCATEAVKLFLEKDRSMQTTPQDGGPKV